MDLFLNDLFIGLLDVAIFAYRLMETFPEVVWIFYALYLLPAGIALARRHRNVFPIALFNVLFGITGIGWLIALVLAFTGMPRPPRPLPRRLPPVITAETFTK